MAAEMAAVAVAEMAAETTAPTTAGAVVPTAASSATPTAASTVAAVAISGQAHHVMCSRNRPRGRTTHRRTRLVRRRQRPARPQLLPCVDPLIFVSLRIHRVGRHS
eukprot:4457455-Prymnesium_polylepis.1